MNNNVFMTALSKKILRIIFSFRSLKFLFILIIGLSFNIALFGSVVNAIATPTPPSNVGLLPDIGEPPCSIYDSSNLSWGRSGKKSSDGKGLYETGSLDDQADRGHPFTKEAYRILGKDPIYLSNDYNAEDTYDVTGAMDRVVGGTGDKNREDTLTLGDATSNNSIRMPCKISGSVSGLIPRDGLDVTKNFSNCKWSSLIGYIPGHTKTPDGLGMTLKGLCKEDTKLYTSLGTVGSCTIDMKFKKDEYSYFSIIDPQQGKPDDHDAIIRVAYAQGAFIRRVVDSTDKKINDRYTNTKTAMTQFDDMITKVSPFSNAQKIATPTNDGYSLASALSSSIDDLKQPVRYGPTAADVVTPTEFLFNKDNVDMSSLLSSPRLGVLNNYKFSETVGDLNFNNIEGFYYINDKQIADYSQKTSFLCNKRTVTFTYTKSGAKSLEKSFPLYEWIPYTLARVAAPTCEATSTAGSKVQPENSVIKNADGSVQKYVICTPCILPDVFKTDLFHQPVKGIPTAIGCLPSSINGVVTVLMRIAVTTAGGIALIIITISGIRMMTNSDNPDEIKKAQHNISSAVTGLLVIVCTLLLLNLVGIKILDLGAFGGTELQFIQTGTANP